MHKKMNQSIHLLFLQINVEKCTLFYLPVINRFDKGESNDKVAKQWLNVG